jgi:precorrin-2/cobalt-factor-2 C20-methyltransferase
MIIPNHQEIAFTAGAFYGIGVGPGPVGYIPVAAWEALQKADIILVPRAKSKEQSIARECLHGLALPENSFREVIYNMDCDHASLAEHYGQLAESIVYELQLGKNVAYLTIGDTLTYSTYSYLLEALQRLCPNVSTHTFPGITSYAGAAAVLGWPLGQGKEKVLILPCPDEMAELKEDIEKHDVIVLMKIGNRLPLVIQLLEEMGITKQCGLVSRLGLVGEIIVRDISQVQINESLGYLTTILIRKNKTVEMAEAGRG